MKKHGYVVAAWALVLGVAMIAGSGCESVGLRSMRIYIQQQNWQKALDQGRIAVAENPNDVEAWFAIAQVAAQVDSFDLMLRAMEKTQSLTNKHDEEIAQIKLAKYNSVFNQAVAKYNGKDYSGATKLLHLAMRIDSTRANAYKVDAMVHHRNGEYPEALDSYSKALAADSTDIDVGRNYALLLAKTGDTDKALAVIDRLYAANPGSKDVALTYIKLLAQGKKYDQALSIAKQALAQDPSDVDLNARAGVLNMQKATLANDSAAIAKNLGAAIPYFQRVLADDSTNTDAAYDLAICFRQLGRLNEAIMPLRRILSLRPDDNQSRLQLAIIYLQEEQPEKAESHLLKIVDQIGDPTSGEQRQTLSKTYRYLSIIYTVRGNKLGARAQTLTEEADALRGRAHRAEKKAKLREASQLREKSRQLFEKSHNMDKLSRQYAE